MVKVTPLFIPLLQAKKGERKQRISVKTAKHLLRVVLKASVCVVFSSSDTQCCHRSGK